VVCDRPDELPAAIHRAQIMDPVVCRRHVAEHFGVAQFGSGYERIYRTVVGTAVSASRPKLRRVLRERSNVAEPTTA
jgi:hypothetical protein